MEKDHEMPILVLDLLLSLRRMGIETSLMTGLMVILPT